MIQFGPLNKMKMFFFLLKYKLHILLYHAMSHKSLMYQIRGKKRKSFFIMLLKIGPKSRH